MKLLFPLLVLLLSGCFFNKPEIITKIVVYEPPEELMTPPKPLKKIVQPEADKKDTPPAK